MYSIRKIKDRFKSKVMPRTYFIELAELGLLEEYLNMKFYEQYNQNQKFRNEMLEILFNYAPKPALIMDKLYLETINQTLNLFLEKTQKWTTQKH